MGELSIDKIVILDYNREKRVCEPRCTIKRHSRILKGVY